MKCPSCFRHRSWIHCLGGAVAGGCYHNLVPGRGAEGVVVVVVAAAAGDGGAGYDGGCCCCCGDCAGDDCWLGVGQAGAAVRCGAALLLTSASSCSPLRVFCSFAPSLLCTRLLV